jgi:hypothetical protein
VRRVPPGIEPELLDQHRSEGRWRVVVCCSVTPGMRYARREWADALEGRALMGQRQRTVGQAGLTAEAP